MIIHEDPQCEVHKTTVPHPLSAGDTVYATNWGSFPSRHRTHINTMRARSAIVNRRYLSNESTGNKKRPGPAATDRSTPRGFGGFDPSRPGSSVSQSSGVILEQIHRAKMGELPFVATCHRYPLSPQRRPVSAVPKAVVSRLTSEQTASSRAKSAGSSGRGHEVRGRAGGHGGYSWLTLNLFADSKRTLYDTEGGLRGSKRTNVK